MTFDICHYPYYDNLRRVGETSLHIIIGLVTKDFFKNKLSTLPAIVQLVLEIYEDINVVTNVTFTALLVAIQLVSLQMHIIRVFHFFTISYYLKI